jgi:glycosyltransferase involved in cell wall biosynthesis
VRVHVVDPSAYTPPYDHALCAALARRGTAVELYTSRFPYASTPPPAGYERHEFFYGAAQGGAGSRLRRASKLAQHVPGMLHYRSAAQTADIVHFQWLALPELDGLLLPRGRPLVLTAHEPLAREAHAWRSAAQRRLYRRFDALIAHTASGAARLVSQLGVAAERVHVIEHGAFAHLAALPDSPLPPELRASELPVVLCFGLIRPYKGVELLLEAWRGVSDAELWIVGRPRGTDLAALRGPGSPARVRWLPRFVSDAELAACFRHATLAVIPYRDSEQSGVLATALAFGVPTVLSDVGGLREAAGAGAARSVPAADPIALREAIVELLGDQQARERLAAGARALAGGEWSWERVAERHLALYEQLLS